MKNYWLQLRKSKTQPTFSFELIGKIPPCEVTVVENGPGHVWGPCLTLKSRDQVFYNFVSNSPSCSAVDGFLTVYIDGQVVEAWAFYNVQITAYSYGNIGVTSKKEASFTFTCANAKYGEEQVFPNELNGGTCRPLKPSSTISLSPTKSTTL